MHLANTSPLPLGGVESLPERRIAGLLTEGRERTLALVEPLSEAEIDRQHSPIMSPLAWDLGHIAAFADLWISRACPWLAPLRPDLFDVYDATETPRAGRGDLPYLRSADALAYGAEVLERALAALKHVDLSPAGDELNAGGYVWDMIVQHEHQHNETMVQAMQLAGELPAPLGAPQPASADVPASGRAPVRVAGWSVPIGASGERFSYDNERPRHEVELRAFELDRTPVTNGEYRKWLEAGGYRRREWWSREGWEWRVRQGVERPLYWTGDGAERRFDTTVALDPHAPVCHVSFYEADAFARAHGKRLPSELEWEAAATWDGRAGRKLEFPWGEEEPSADRAGIDLGAAGPAPAVAHPGGEAPCGALALVGDVWEWTASELSGYPGFRAFPYREYSEIFFRTGLRVLRGGSWATRPTIARPTFRNWDLPERRQIFAGFRCAQDA